ncbi:MAG TPA: acyl-CoA dehydrogenase family protein [Polyangiales bacterium]|nr:acyl-CoA dehydrogenase family protein [Polyangiales bacterium]
MANRDFIELAREIGPAFADRAAAHDLEGTFVTENYADLKRHTVLSAAVPTELGGGGASHAEICGMLREMARHCGSTALALSMHTHLVATNVYRHRHGQPAEALLRKVSASELVLVSTGAGDWLDSVGQAERVPGGYNVNAIKRFASGAPVGDLIVTSAPIEDAERGPQVIHFALPLNGPGVSVHDDWNTLGMRGTGSHSVELKDAFVPEQSVSLTRPRGQWHPFWSVVIVVAPPIYMAPYMGIAERAAELAREDALRRRSDWSTWQALGELENCLTTAQMAFREMVELVNEYDFQPEVERASRMLVRKTIATNAMLATVNKAIELVGGKSLFRRNGIERLLRDIQGARYHPLPEKQQLAFTGRVELGLPPVV